MSDLIPTHRLTHSKLGLTEFCTHWCSKEGPDWPENSVGRGAQVGSAFHLLAECRINRSAVDTKELLEASGFGGGIARDAQSLFVVGGEWIENNVPPHARTEVGLAFDPQTGLGREIAMKEARDYSQALPREVPGTADLFWVEEASGHVKGFEAIYGIGPTEKKVVYLFDWETGRSYYKGAAHECDQISMGAICVADIYGADVAVVGILHVSVDKGVEVREHFIDEFEMAARRESFRERGRFQTEASPPKPGWWCKGKWCPCRSTCSVSATDGLKAIKMGGEAAQAEDPEGALVPSYESQIALHIDSDEKWREVRAARLRAEAYLEKVKTIEDNYAKAHGGVETASGKVYGPHTSNSEKMSETKAMKQLVELLTEEELDLVAPRKVSKTSISKGLPKERRDEVLSALRDGKALTPTKRIRWEER